MREGREKGRGELSFGTSEFVHNSVPSEGTAVTRELTKGTALGCMALFEKIANDMPVVRLQKKIVTFNKKKCKERRGTSKVVPLTFC